MDDLKTRLTSRKFLAMVASILVAIAGVLNQTIDPGTGANLIVTAVVAYIAAEGAVDVAQAVTAHKAPQEPREPAEDAPRQVTRFVSPEVRRERINRDKRNGIRG